MPFFRFRNDLVIPHPSTPTQPPVQWIVGPFPMCKAAGAWCYYVNPF